MRTTFLHLSHDLIQSEQWDGDGMINKFHLRIKMDPRSDEPLEPWHLLPLLSGYLSDTELVVWDMEQTRMRLNTLRQYAKGAMEKIKPLTDFAKAVGEHWSWQRRSGCEERWIDMKEVYEITHDIRDVEFRDVEIDGSSVVKLRTLFFLSKYQTCINAMRGV